MVEKIANYFVSIQSDCPSSVTSGATSPSTYTGGGGSVTVVASSTGGQIGSGYIAGSYSSPIQTSNPCNCKDEGAAIEECKECKNGQATNKAEGTSCKDDGNPYTCDVCKGGECKHIGNSGTVVRSTCLDCDFAKVWSCTQESLPGAVQGLAPCYECIKTVVSSRGMIWPPSCAECTSAISDFMDIYKCVDRYCSTYVVEWDTLKIGSNTNACQCAGGKPQQIMGIDTLGRNIYGVDLSKDCSCK